MIDNVNDAILEQQAAREEQEALERGRQLRQIIDLGIQVEAFLASDLGKRLEHDARTERVGLTEKYVLLNPDIPAERQQMQDIRFRVHVLNAWQEFFAEYMQRGRDAEAQFIESEQTD